MIDITVTPQVKQDILNAIKDMEKIISKEMAFPVELRKHGKVAMYTKQIKIHCNYLETGIIN